MRAAVLAVLIVSGILAGERAEAGAAPRMFGVFGTVSGCEKLEGLPPTRWISADASFCNQYAVLKEFSRAVKSAGEGGRIYFRAACQPEGEFAVPFPQIAVRPSPHGKTGLAAARAIFPDDNDVTVTQRTPGVVKVRIGDMPDAILRTRIAVLTLDEGDRYSAFDAMLAVINSKDVEAAEKKLGIWMPIGFVDHAEADSSGSMPHLPAVMRNVTLDEALDWIARTFDVVILYGAEGCAGGHQFDLNLADVL